MGVLSVSGRMYAWMLYLSSNVRTSRLITLANRGPLLPWNSVMVWVLWSHETFLKTEHIAFFSFLPAYLSFLFSFLSFFSPSLFFLSLPFPLPLLPLKPSLPFPRCLAGSWGHCCSVTYKVLYKCKVLCGSPQVLYFLCPRQKAFIPGSALVSFKHNSSILLL